MFENRNWIYDHEEPLTRYSLGQEGTNPLICFGVNPSTAKPENLDPTVASVARFAKAEGYDGWLMFNLYPQRATNPDKMHKRFQKNIQDKNLKAISEILSALPNGLDVWCAWGTLIEKRTYLTSCLENIYTVLDANDCRYFTRGNISKAGHPHHPLYLRKESIMDEFDMGEYVDMIT